MAIIKNLLLDDEDEHLLMACTWSVGSHGYAQGRWSGAGDARVLLHKLVMPCAKGFQIDHKNGNKLDCRKENLRIVTVSQNRMNRPANKIKKYSKHKGVSFHRATGKWMAQVQMNKKSVFSKLFSSEEQARVAYISAAKKHFKEFAYESRG